MDFLKFAQMFIIKCPIRLYIFYDRENIYRFFFSVIEIFLKMQTVLQNFLLQVMNIVVYFIFRFLRDFARSVLGSPDYSFISLHDL